ncbi:MAG: hypothetical protein WDN76_07305 [Alphaproteobacteria bacterium]
MTDGARGAIRTWREKATQLEEKIARADSIFGAHPGVVLIWEDGAPPAEEHDWGKPRLYGSPLALASLLRFFRRRLGADRSLDPDPSGPGYV